MTTLLVIPDEWVSVLLVAVVVVLWIAGWVGYHMGRG